MKYTQYLQRRGVIFVLVLLALAIIVNVDWSNLIDRLRPNDDNSNPTPAGQREFELTQVAFAATQTAFAKISQATDTPIPPPPPSPTDTPVPTPTPTDTPSPTPTNTDTLTPTWTNTPSETPTPTLTLTPSFTPTHTWTPSQTPSVIGPGGVTLITPTPVPQAECGPAWQINPESGFDDPIVLESGDGWLHIDLSPNVLGYDEVSLLLEPNTHVTLTEVNAVGWLYPPGCSRDFIEGQIAAHQANRRSQGKSISTIDLQQLHQTGHLIAARVPPTSGPDLLTVSSLEEAGASYDCATTGTYRITITGGAYNTWGSNKPGEWRTIIYIFVGDIEWDAKGEPTSPYHVGNYQSTAGESFETAQAAGIGWTEVVTCNAGDTLTFVTVDTRGSYSNLNAGEVTISIQLETSIGRTSPLNGDV